MRIGFDISQTGKEKAGCGYFADGLVHEIARQDKKNHYVLYPTFGSFYWDNDFDNINSISQPNFTKGKSAKTLNDARLFWENPVGIIEQEFGNLDILHSNNFFCPEKKISTTKFVYTLYDLSFIEYPEWATSQNRICCFDSVFNASLNADHIIAISEYSKKNFLALFPHYPEENMTVVYPASRYQRDETVQKSQKLSSLSPKKFWLSVGTIEPRKNQKFLLRAYAELKKYCHATNKALLPLVFAGKPGWLMENIEKYVTELDLTENILWLGYVDEQELQWLYQHCYCFLYPSLFEGFGMPVLEAMSCAAVTITSNTSAIPEITGEPCLLIDPLEITTLIDAMKRCVDGKVDFFNLSQQTLKQAQRFSWTESAKKILDLYKVLCFKKTSPFCAK